MMLEEEITKNKSSCKITNKTFVSFIGDRSIKYHYKRDIGLTGKLFYKLYNFNIPALRRLILSLLIRFLGVHYELYSITLRRIFSDYHGIMVGDYSHGGCFNPRLIPPGTRIGRYCSLARTVSVHNANHPNSTLSSHAFFFNTNLGIVQKDIISRTKLTIGNDVFIGHNVIILMSCTSIGDGAVIGAGSVVNKNIPPYAIVVGNPSRIVLYRFSKEKIQELLEGKWWEKPIYELTDRIEEFQTPLESSLVR